MRKVNELRPYQQRIATFLYENNEALCVVRPGGGKTIAALTAVDELQRDGVIRHALVIAPKRVARAVWPDELNGWEHMLGMLCCHLVGDQKERRQRLLGAHDGPICEIDTDLTLIGIDLVEWLFRAIERWPADHPIFDLLIIDEISKLRNPTGVRAKLIAKNVDRWRMVWGLSGTLRPSSALDLFMPVRVVTRAKLWGKSYYDWRKFRFYPIDYRGYDWLPLPGTEDKLNAEIAPLTVTLKDEDMPQLPELSVILDRVTLPPNAQIQYHDMHRKLVAKSGDKAVLAANSAVATGKLAQIANGFLYDKGRPEFSETDLTIAIHDEKRQWLADLVEEATGPTLLVYEYLQDLEMIREVCGEDTPALGAGVSDAASDRNIKAWNAGKLPFMALHPASGGHGLNLQHGGSDMAWIAPTWSPELWEQTIARLHRSGQKRPVIVRVCVARGTVDEMKLDRVYHKLDAQKAFENYLAAYAEIGLDD